ncbi:phage tail tape measure protein [Kordia sp. SMS9]|uniref:phage tail tape measure protein n=1 Tax=Kordia sp. SMS9 TaxID=2282170 RepID=UPI0013B3C3FB|nr:phage tail tape measure protein [Kordia sp. SMS9]
MRGNIDKLKASHVKAFRTMRDEIPLFGKAMDLIGNPYALIAAGLISLTLLFGKGYAEAKRFNHEFLQIKQLNLDKNSKQLASYKENIRDAAFEVGTNLRDSTKAFYDLQSATGVYGDDAVAIFKKVGRYSIATGAELGDSMNATTKAMKAFGLGVKDIDSFLVSNAKTVQVGITTFDELARVQTEYAGAAAGAGQTVDTANKIFAAFTSIAKDSNTAATMTKSAFEGLTQKNTVKGLRKIGISLYDTKGNMRDLGDVLQEVSAKFKKMTPKQIDTLIAKIGGPEGLRNLFIKLKTGADDFHNTLNAFDSSQYDLDAALKNAQGDVTVLGDIVRNRFNTAMSKLGELILPLVARGLHFLNSIIVSAYNAYNTFTKWLDSGSLGALIFKGAMIGLATAITLNLLPLALMGAKILLVTTATTLWTGAQWLLNTAIKKNPIVFILSLIGALIGAIVKVVRMTEGWGKSWVALKKIAGVVWSQMKLDFFYLVDSIKYGIEVAWLKFKNIGQHIVGFAKKVKEAVALAWSGKFSAAASKMKEKIVTEADRQLEELDKKRQRQNAAYKKSTQENRNTVKELKKDIGISWKKEKQEDKKSEGLLTDGGGDTGSKDKKSLGSVAGGQIGDVTDSASGAKNISITIDAFNKGGINTTNTTLNKMNKQEIEQWMEETFLRMVRATELSYD